MLSAMRIRCIRSVFSIALILFILSGCSKQALINDNNNGREEVLQDSEIVEPVEDNFINTSELSRVFGFTNQESNLIITSGHQENVNNVEDINKAIGENGNILDIRYLRTQTQGEKDNGRLTSQNFDNLQGKIFEITSGKARANETYYLVKGMEFNTDAVLNSQESNHHNASADTIEEIERIKGRNIKDSWEIGRIEADTAVYLILFERDKDDMLASIVMKTPTKLVFKDYPAKYDEMSTWRVDDGGSIFPEMFSILFAAKTKDGMLLGLKWTGFEGENTIMLLENDGVFEELNIESYRYTSPV